jgi:glycopeptide antibiotics resistance protein
MRYIKSIITVIILSNIILSGADAIICQINNCYNDVASRIAISSLGLFLFVVYTACTIFLVFLPNLYLVKLLGYLKAALLSSFVSASLISWLMYNSKVDTMSGILGLFFWFFIPWFTSIYIGSKLWPNKAFKSPTARTAKSAAV